MTNHDTDVGAAGSKANHGISAYGSDGTSSLIPHANIPFHYTASGVIGWLSTVCCIVLFGLLMRNPETIKLATLIEQPIGLSFLGCIALFTISWIVLLIGYLRLDNRNRGHTEPKESRLQSFIGSNERPNRDRMALRVRQLGQPKEDGSMYQVGVGDLIFTQRGVAYIYRYFPHKRNIFEAASGTTEKDHQDEMARLDAKADDERKKQMETPLLEILSSSSEFITCENISEMSMSDNSILTITHIAGIMRFIVSDRSAEWFQDQLKDMRLRCNIPERGFEHYSPESIKTLGDREYSSDDNKLQSTFEILGKHPVMISDLSKTLSIKQCKALRGVADKTKTNLRIRKLTLEHLSDENIGMLFVGAGVVFPIGAIGISLFLWLTGGWDAPMNILKIIIGLLIFAVLIAGISIPPASIFEILRINHEVAVDHATRNKEKVNR